jgi:adenylate cyclase
LTEIERKWSPTDLPGDLPEGHHIRQGYVALDGEVEVRIRDREGSFTLTVKGGSGLERDEIEVDLDRDAFDSLWSLAAGRTIEKVRHAVDVGDHEAEVDVYRGAHDGLRVVEVEFESMKDAEAFDPPDWFGDERTGDPRWSNRALAVDGPPTEFPPPPMRS